MSRGGYVETIEAAHAVDRVARREWLDQILSAVAPVLAGEFGLIGMLYDASNPASMQTTELVSTGEPRFTDITREIVTTRVDSEYVENTYRVLPCAFASETPNLNRTGFELFHEFGVHDLLGVNGVDPTGLGCFIGMPVAKRFRLSAKQRDALCRISTHLAAGYRLLRQGVHAREEAILSPDGRIEHADGDAKLEDARDRLVRAVKDMEQARGRLRKKDPFRAAELWGAMVSARWTLVDQFESDGKRYVVARVNEAIASRIEELSARERQVADFIALGHSTKLVAYELGLSHSTVRVLLGRIYAKLGVKGRAEFVKAWRARLASTH